MEEPFEEEKFSIIEYVKENYIGLLLLLLAGVIVYVVDYITHVNALFFSSPSPIPGVPGSATTVVNMLQKKKKPKKR